MSFAQHTAAWNRQRVEALLRRSTTFTQLLRDLDGQFPTDVLAALRTLERTDANDGRVQVARLIAEATANFQQASCDQIACLPLPHPSDYEWRFDASTADTMLERVQRAAGPNGLVLLVGMPSLVVAAASSDSQGRYSVLGTDDVVWDTLRSLTNGDKRFVGASDDEQASAVVVDPPWYASAYREMFELFSHRCRIGSHIFAGAPPFGTRPTAAADRDEIIALATQRGLTLVGTEPGRLRYRSPGFELAALRAGGVNAHLPDWRRGDLLIFEKSHNPQPPAQIAYHRPPAFEITLRGIRLRLTPLASAVGKPLAPISDSEVYPSVSTRGPTRSLANLWTSGNRAFSVDALTALSALGALVLATGGTDNTAKDLENLIALNEHLPTQSLMARLRETVAQETAEMEALVGEASWLRSVNDARFLNGSLSDFLASLDYGDASPTSS